MQYMYCTVVQLYMYLGTVVLGLITQWLNPLREFLAPCFSPQLESAAPLVQLYTPAGRPDKCWRSGLFLANHPLARPQPQATSRLHMAMLL